MASHFGEHLTIDGYDGSLEKLNDKEVVLHCLQELPGKLGMRQIADPAVYWVDANGKKDPGGWTGVVVLHESHISIHTFPARGFVSADVYTCQNGLDTEFVANYFQQAFALKDIEKHFIQRGMRYPKENIY